MSKVKIEGNASGTGTLTISAPNTDTDRSLTLPDGAGEILTDASTLSSSNLSGALPAIDGSALTGIGGGITHASRWVVPSAYTSNDKDPVTGWSEAERYIGSSSMTESSGTFTFPETGIWEIDLTVSHYISSGSSLYVENVAGRIYYSTDGGSNWTNGISGHTNFNSPGNDWWRVQTHAKYIFDVTDTSTHKIKFTTYVYGGTGLYIEIGGDSSGVYFKRLGDT